MSGQKKGFLFGKGRKVLPSIKITFSEPIRKFDLSPVSYSCFDERKELVFPNAINPRLAEEIGMHVGDGFLSARKYEYRLKGSKIDEREFYQDFIRPLYKELYNLDVSIRDYEESYGFEVYSKALWTFKSKVLGIPPGKKTRIRVPGVVKVNDQEVLAAFIRGYFDTDGSLSFVSKYGYSSYYPIVSASSVSEFLIKDVAEILSMFGLGPYVWFSGEYWSVQMFGYSKFVRFWNLIGWNSKKYVDKIRVWRDKYPDLVDGAGSVAWLKSRTLPVSTKACGAFDPSSNLGLRPIFLEKMS